MNLRKLSILRLPGFEAGGPDLGELGPGLNVLTGPNASGKTSVCRAIRGLLWPESLRDVSPVSLVGEFEQAGVTLRLELEGDRATCQRDGVPSERPELPPPHLADCFTVTVEDLYRGTESDAELARGVAREMAGGYDLPALLALEAFRPARNRGRLEARRLQEQRQAAQQIAAAQQALQAEEDELAQLRRQEQEALAAQARRRDLEEAGRLLEVRENLTAIAARLESLPPGMELIRGDEEERLEHLRGDEQRAEQEHAAALDVQGQAEAAIAAAALPEGGLTTLRLRELQAHLEELRQAEELCGQTAREAEQAVERARLARAGLGRTALAEQLDRLPPVELDAVDAFQRDWEANQEAQAACRERLALLPQTPPPHSGEVLTRGALLLRQWLEGGGAARPSGRVRGLAWLLVAVSALYTAALALLLAPAWWLLLVAPALAVVVLLLEGRGGTDEARGAPREQYLRLLLDPPRAWEPEHVGEHLAALEIELAAARRTEEGLAERGGLQARADRLAEAAVALAQRRAGLAATLGLAPDTSPLALTVLAASLRRYQEARAEETARGAAAASAARAHRAALEAVNTSLVDCGAAAADSYAVARVRSSDLERRAAEDAGARERLAAAAYTQQASADEQDRLCRRRRQLFAEAGLQDGDLPGLLQRLELRAAYQEALEKQRGLRAEEQALLARLADSDLVGYSGAELEAEDRRQEELLARCDDLRQRIIAISGRVQAAGAGTALEEAVAAREAARDELAARRREAELAAAGALLVEEVAAEYEVQGRPAVLRQASHWLALFTRGRYELRLQDGPDGAPAFSGFDTRRRRGLPLAALSTGTRMQLLLAVRLAFAAAAEHGDPLPLLLDEVLASSDPVRCRAIIEAVLALVGEGRQVLYCTCQPGDVRAWREVAAELGLPAPQVVELAPAGPRETGELLLPVESAVAVPVIPEPAGRSLAEYAAALGVPPLRPGEGAAAAHLAYLVAEPEQLYRLLTAGIESLGALEALAAHGDAGAYVMPEVLARIRVRAQVLEAFAAAWSVGRGKPLSREVLLAAGVTESFIDRVCDLARGVCWDARRLVTALQTREDDRARGFRTAALEALVERLTDSGHLAVETPLDREQVLLRVLSALNEAVQRNLIAPSEVRGMCAGLWEACEAGERGS